MKQKSQSEFKKNEMNNSGPESFIFTLWFIVIRYLQGEWIIKWNEKTDILFCSPTTSCKNPSNSISLHGKHGGQQQKNQKYTTK